MNTLLVGYKSRDLFERGRHGKTRTAPWAAEEGVTCHTLDIYDRHAIEKTHHIRTLCSAHLPEGPWDAIRFHAGPKVMSGETALDLLQEVRGLLGGQMKPPRFILDFEGRERDRVSLMEKAAGRDARPRDFSAAWKASVPGGPEIELVSFPGCFCHRRVDEGGLALAEVVSRELAAGGPAGARLLDMGCGAGTVGLLVASANPGISLVMVDSTAGRPRAWTAHSTSSRGIRRTIPTTG